MMLKMVLVSLMHLLLLIKLVATGVVTYDTEGAFYVTNAEGTNSQSFTISMDKTFDNGLDVFASYTNLDAESGWVATSSQLSSNLEYMPRVDLMNVGVGKTPWAIEDRIVAGLNYTVNWFPNAPTKFSLFYKAYSGKRFSYVFDGIDDGYDDGNTLLYIPTANDPNVVYSGVTEGEVLDSCSRYRYSWLASLLLILVNFHIQDIRFKNFSRNSLCLVL